MTQLPKKVKLLLITQKDPSGSEFVPIPTFLSPNDIFIISVEDLTLHFLMDNFTQGKLSGSTAKYPTSISILGPFGHSGQ